MTALFTEKSKLPDTHFHQLIADADFISPFNSKSSLNRKRSYLISNIQVKTMLPQILNDCEKNTVIFIFTFRTEPTGLTFYSVNFSTLNKSYPNQVFQMSQ